MFCECSFADDYFRAMHKRDHVKAVLEGRGGVSYKGGSSGSSRDTAALAEKSVSIAAKRGLDVVMIFLFLVTLGRGLTLVYYARNDSGAADADAAEHALPDFTPSNAEDAELGKSGASVSEEPVRG